MLEVIDDVLRAETQADKLVQDARDEANRLQSEFASQESDALKNARVAADKQLREELAEVREEQARRVAETEDRIREESRSLTTDQDSRIGECLARLVDLVTGRE